MTLRDDVQYAPFDISAAGPTQLVAAVSGRKIRIHALVLETDAKTDVTIQDDAGTPNVLLGPFPECSLAPWVLPFSEAGWAETATGQDLDLLLGGAVQSVGTIIYSET